jgi:O-antigen/teichoic acid export membrane protein
VAFWGLQLIDRYLLAALRDTGAVGVYSVGAVIGDKGILIPTFAFAVAARPLLITAFERHGRAEVERLMRAYSRIVLLVGLPVIALAAATSHVLIPLLSSGYYQRFYAPAAPVVPIVAAGSLIYAVSRVGETGLLVVAKRTRPLVYAALFALVINVAANLILIPPFGIKGAAIATPISYLALLLGVQWYARHHATWRFPYMTLIRGGLAAGVAYVAARFALEGVDGRVPKLVVAAAACVVAYAVSLALLGERRGGEATASA